MDHKLSATKFGIREFWNSALALSSGQVSGSGKFINQFERDFSKKLNVRHSLAVSNGTVALHLALLSLSIGPGDEVIVPAFGYVAFANSVLYVGAKPVFVDVDSEDWCLQVNQVEAAINSRTKAVIAVHNYGALGQIEALVEMCKRYQIPVIEDSAEALFGQKSGKYAGSFGDIGTFSFFGNKIMTSGEGGAIVTSNSQLYERIKLLRGQGMHPNRRYYFPEVGYNYRLSNLSASLLCAQLTRVEDLILRRSLVFDEYSRCFANAKGLTFNKNILSPWLFTIVLAKTKLRNSLMYYLENLGIETRPTFYPIFQLPAFQQFNIGKYPIAEQLAMNGVSLPTHPKMSLKDVRLIAHHILDFLTNHD